SGPGQISGGQESNQVSEAPVTAHSQTVGKQEATGQPELKIDSDMQPGAETDRESASLQSQPLTEIKKTHDEVGRRVPDVNEAQRAAETNETRKDIQAISTVNRPVKEEHSISKAPNVTAATRIKGFVFGHVKISERDAYPFIEELKIGLLQSDVNYDVAEKVTESIRINLIGKEADSKNIVKAIRQGIRESIISVLSKRAEVDLIKEINERKARNELPYKILFLGPNGAGKTTTMAKIANLLLSNNITCVLSASDTFRAAAIEQTAYHAAKLGINVIKGTYGADPASVAFDAIAHAKAHNTMAVLIDSAGRQETNKSLVEELKKMVRVTKPDLKIFVGEGISGNALLEQVKILNQAVGLDGIILTKLDVDAKGGNTLSILSDTTVPILFFGTGEGYNDIMRYDPSFIVDNILPNN
ncbi:MAG: signal recognition particle-docking protein FtsY, partial [Candidatus Micrarchaeaceae archaeon]